MRTKLTVSKDKRSITLIDYYLSDSNNDLAELHLNPIIGNTLKIDFLGSIHCVNCQKKTSKSYGNGFCFKCFMKLPECDSCIVRPEKCHYHLGTCRDSSWGEKHCLIPHVVYLSYTSDLKVGITREIQLKTRWVDQGAIRGLPLFRIQQRLEAGRLEVYLKGRFKDKTNYSKMLQMEDSSQIPSLESFRESIFTEFEDKLEEFVLEFGEDHLELFEEEVEVSLCYPLLKQPEKIKRFDLKKSSSLEGTLLGIKGQYLILDTGVINIRNYSGYDINFIY